MSRTPSRGAVARCALALALLSSPLSRASAEDDIVDKAKKVQAAQQTLGNKVDAFTKAASDRKERAADAVDDAKERAKSAAERAKERSELMAESLEERAHDAADNAKAYAGELKGSLAARVQKLGDDAKGMVDSAKGSFKNAVQSARDQARELLLGAAVALDNRTRDERKAARKKHWDKLRTRYELPDRAPTMEISEELRDHEYRLARLRRARDLADGVRDELEVAHCDQLIEREYARHRARLNKLIEKERRIADMNAGEAPSYGADE